MTDVKLQAWWARRQGLDGSLDGASPADVLERAGWARSVGGSAPYLSLFARSGSSRHAIDQAVAQLEIHELPAARGCTYVLPSKDFATGLAAGRSFAEAPLRVAATLGVAEREVSGLEDAVVRVLKSGPMEPAAIRKSLGDAVRSLGEAGRKKGVTTTLPLALGRLQAHGRIRRIPVNGRLDQQRYAYCIWESSPLHKDKRMPEQVLADLARLFWSWVGPATLSEFQWFSGAGSKASAAAVAGLDLKPAASGSDLLLPAPELAEFDKFSPPRKPFYVLVSSLDSITAIRRNVTSLLAEADRDRRLLGDKGLEPAGGLTDLPSHAILDRGRLIGLWEYDPEAREVVWGTFGVRDKALTEAVRRMQEFVAEELGDARQYSLDSAASRAKRIDAIRRMK